MPFENFEVYKAYIDQIQLKHVGDDAVFTGCLITFYEPPFKTYSVVNTIKDVIIFRKLKKMTKKRFFPREHNRFAQSVRVSTERFSDSEYF